MKVKNIIIMNHGFTLPPPRAKKYAMQSGHVFLLLETYFLIPFSLERKVDTHIGSLGVFWSQPNG